MSEQANNLSTFSRLLPLLVGAAVVVASLVLWRALAAQERSHIEHLIELQAASVSQQISGRIESRILPLVRIARQWEADGRPQRQSWEFQAGMNVDHFTGYQAIKWIDPDHVIRWVVPLEGNESVVDVRLGLEESHQEALEETRRSGEVTMLGVVNLLQGGRGFAVYVPIFHEGAFEGFISGVFRVGELFDAMLEEVESEQAIMRGYSFAIFDAGEEVYARYRDARVNEAQWGTEVPLLLPAENWQLRVWPGMTLLAGMQSIMPEAALAVGLLLAVLFSTVVYLAQTSNLRAKESESANRDLENEIAQRQRAQEALHDEQEFLNALLDHLQAGVIACDAQGHLTLYNRSARRFHGLPEESLTAEHWAEYYDLFHGDGKTPMTRTRTPLQRAFHGETIRGEEMVIVPRDGEPRILLASGQPITDAAGRKLGAVVVMHDITEQKAAHEELRRFSGQLARSNNELQNFASVASHDLQEPLRKIQAFGDRLKVKCAQQLTDEGRDYLERMQSAAERMQRLINDLLSFSRVTTKAQPFTAVDLKQVVEDVVSDLEIAVAQSGAEVEVKDLPTIDADPLQVRQLMQNLIGNALKFHRAGVSPRVRVYGRILNGEADPPAMGSPSNGEMCQLIVEDNGIGFNEKYLDRIFAVFQRLHGRADYPGTGVGLAICRKIVERHGGTITARSTPGQGTRFVVTLPVRHAEGEATE